MSQISFSISQWLYPRSVRFTEVHTSTYQFSCYWHKGHFSIKLPKWSLTVCDLPFKHNTCAFSQSESRTITGISIPSSITSLISISFSERLNVWVSPQALIIILTHEAYIPFRMQCITYTIAMGLVPCDSSVYLNCTGCSDFYMYVAGNENLILLCICGKLVKALWLI